MASVVGNFPVVEMPLQFGNEAQKKELIWGQLDGHVSMTFDLTEPHHGSDATHLENTVVRHSRAGQSGGS